MFSFLFTGEDIKALISLIVERVMVMIKMKIFEKIMYKTSQRPLKINNIKKIKEHQQQFGEIMYH